MTSVATGIGVCCAVGLNVATAFLQQTPPPPNPKPAIQTPAKPTETDINLTGCLVQGSGPEVFVLQDARRDPQSTTEKGARYVVVSATEDLSLKTHLNHRVRILGVPDGRPQPTPVAGRPVDEKAIPRLSAKGLTMVSPTCTGTASASAQGSGGGGFFGLGIRNPEPRTVLLIATGLLLVVYAGRRHEWSAWRRRPAR